MEYLPIPQEGEALRLDILSLRGGGNLKQLGTS
jgi:hypothetical protein